MKVVNFVLGLGTAIILAALITLGIKAFYPEPVAPTYPNIAPSAPDRAMRFELIRHARQNNAQIEAQQHGRQQDQYQCSRRLRMTAADADL